MAPTVAERRLTMREARQRYFEVNGFGERGGYDDAWVQFKLGPVPVGIPNTAARVRAVRYHDLHHVLTGYQTDIVGEFEISAWEIGAGCKDFYAAWFLNLSGMAGGLFRCPRRTWRAFLHGKSSQSLYGLPLDELLDLSVQEVRARMHCPETPRSAHISDVVQFVLCVTVGLTLGLALLALAIPVAPLLLLRSVVQRERTPRTA